jgi:site-specific recombinase XerD
LVESGVRHLPLHSARHSVATHLVNGGVNPRIVQLLLGHSSAAYTLATYVHPSLENMREALEITKTGESNPLTSVNMLSSLKSGGNT